MAGDLHIRVKIQKHKVFLRKGADLFMEKNITLLEALIGFNFNINLLDGSTIKVTTLPGDVVKPGTIF